MTDEISITVKLATALARHTGNQKVVDCRLTGNQNLSSVIQHLDSRFPGIRAMILADGSDILDSINVYANGDNVRYLQGLETLMKQGDVINIIPAAAAG
ncbi:MAG: MoaD/ThiS family protein [Desulfobacterales bacterium]|jgi:molybdopterin synthase sulfur carrier subunit|nr:MoaD/ThiS family protein [Desulfobacterales bacterium]